MSNVISFPSTKSKPRVKRGSGLPPPPPPPTDLQLLINTVHGLAKVAKEIRAYVEELENNVIELELKSIKQDERMGRLAARVKELEYLEIKLEKNLELKGSGKID